MSLRFRLPWTLSGTTSTDAFRMVRSVHSNILGYSSRLTANRLRSSLEALPRIRGCRSNFKGGFQISGSSFVGRTRCIREWSVPAILALNKPSYIAQKQGGRHRSSFALRRPFRNRQDLQVHIRCGLQHHVRLLKPRTRQTLAQHVCQFHGAKTRSWGFLHYAHSGSSRVILIWRSWVEFHLCRALRFWRTERSDIAST